MESAAPGREMRGSAKGREPARLRAWKEVQRDNGIDPEYRALPRAERAVTVDSLHAEQTGQCVCCGRGISLGRHDEHHGEHFRPRARYPALQLDYDNLFLSCGPASEYGPRDTCGNHKAGWFAEDCHIPPAPESCAERFRFRSSGEIAGDDTPEAAKMIQILNLNHPELVTERQVVIEDLDRELAEGIPTDVLRQDYLDLDRDGARPSFANVAIGYLGAQSDVAV